MAPCLGCAVLFVLVSGALCVADVSNATLPNETRTTCSVTTGQREVHRFTPIVFDLQCLKDLRVENIECPADAADDLVATWLDELRIESLGLTLLKLFFQICMLQLAGVPNPRTRTGSVFWVLWMLVQLAQCIILLVSVIVTVLTYISTAIHFGDCMMQWKDWMPLLNMLAASTFAFHPMVLSLLCMLFLYGLVAFEGCLISDEDWPSSLLEVLRLLVILASTAMLLVIYVTDVVPTLTCFLVWLLSASWVFGALFFLPLSLIVALGLWSCVFLFHQARKCYDRKDALDKKLDQIFWWASCMMGYGTNQGLFVPMLRFSFMLVVLSPMIVWGTWTALYTYDGGSSKQHLDMVGLIYTHTFQVIGTMDIARPAISFNISLPDDFLKAPPLQLLEGVRALGTLNLVISVLKPLVTGANTFFATFQECDQKATVALSDIFAVPAPEPCGASTGSGPDASIAV